MQWKAFFLDGMFVGKVKMSLTMQLLQD